MFDSVPPNLPVEPTPPPVNPMTPPPAAPPATPPITVPPTVMSTAGKKEPEDIFSGLDQATQSKGGTVAGMMGEPPRAFPVKLVAMIFGGIVVLALAGAGVYFFVVKPRLSTTTPSAPSAAPAPTQPIGIPAPKPTPIEQPPAAAVATPPPIEVPTAATSAVVEVPPPVTQPPAGIVLPPPTPVVPVAAVVSEGVDTDHDGLTDVEEPYYNADVGKSDTDGDGYMDGAEVSSLYDPAKKGTMLESAAYMSKPTWSEFSFLLPKPWSIIPMSGTTTRAQIATGSATRFDLELVLNPNKRSFDGLLAEQGIVAPRQLHTKRGYEARQSEDGLRTYIAMGDKVLLIAYDLNGDASYEYRTSYQMVIQSVQMQFGK